MKSLLSAARTALRGAAGLSYVADADIRVTPDPDWFPIGGGLPAITIKDGPVTGLGSADYAKGSDIGFQARLQVHYFIWVAFQSGDISIMGQADPAIKGTLDLRADIHTVLVDNTLSESGIIAAFCAEEGESETIVFDDGLLVVRKRLTYEYLKLVEY